MCASRLKKINLFKKVTFHNFIMILIWPKGKGIKENQAK